VCGSVAKALANAGRRCAISNLERLKLRPTIGFGFGFGFRTRLLSSILSELISSWCWLLAPPLGLAPDALVNPTPLLFALLPVPDPEPLLFKVLQALLPADTASPL